MRDLIRLMWVMVDLYCASYTKPPEAVTLDIDDTVAQIASATRALQAMLEVIDRSRREGFDVLDKTDEYGRASPR